MKFNFDKTNKQLVVSMSWGLLADQVVTFAFAFIIVGGIFWYGAE